MSTSSQPTPIATPEGSPTFDITEVDLVDFPPNPTFVRAAEDEFHACLKTRSPGGLSIIPRLRLTALEGAGDVVIAVTWTVRWGARVLTSEVRLGNEPASQHSLYTLERPGTRHSARVHILPWSRWARLRIVLSGRRCQVVELRGKFLGDGGFEVRADLETLARIQDWCPGGQPNAAR